MASILEFRKPAFEFRRTSAKSEAAASADVVLFPGVRYERWAEPPESAKPRRRARRRDHLDLED